MQYDTELDSKHIDRYRVSSRPLLSQQDLLRMLIPTIYNPPDKELSSSLRPMANFTYTSYRFPTRGGRLISLTLDFMDVESFVPSWLAIATCPMSGVALHLVQDRGGDSVDVLTKSHRKHLDSSELKRWKQPLVAVECYRSENTTGSRASFEFGAFGRMDVLDSDKDSSFKELLESAQRKKSPQFGYQIVDLQDTEESSISAAMMFVNGSRWTDDDTRLQTQEEGALQLHLCRIHARWEEADVWIERGKSSFVQSQLDLPLFKIHHCFGDSAKDSDTIKMKKEWLAALGERTGPDSIIPNQTTSAYQQIRDFCYSGAASFQPHVCFCITLAAHLTDALSQTGNKYSFIRTKKIEEDPSLPRNTIIHQTYFLGGHVYDFKGSRAIPFAISILLLHVVVVLIHVVAVVLSRHPWHVSSWSSFGRILVLALRSKASDQLGSVGGGVESSQTWTTTTSVRVIGDEGRIEMILRKRRRGMGEDQQLEDGVDNERGVTRVQPDIKYH